MGVIDNGDGTLTRTGLPEAAKKMLGIKPIRLEVRCCCQPQKLLGWLDVAFTDKRHLPRSICFPVTSGWRVGGRPVFNQIELPVATVNNGGEDYPALKAEGITLDTLRKLRGFTEA